MQPLFSLFTQSGFVFRRGTLVLLLATPMIFPFGLPAQAGFWATLRGIVTGDTGEGARGNARGAAIRDRRCGAEAPTVSSDGSDEDGNAIVTPDLSIGSTESLILLAPNTGQTLTTSTVPEVFVYIPPSISEAEEPVAPLLSEPAPKINQTKIDLDDIDSVVDTDLQDEVDQAQQPELLLELQFDGTTRYYSLPDEAMIAKLQAPAETAFEIGEISSLEVRLVCRRANLTSLSQAAEIKSSYSTETEVFVDVQRVEPSDQLIAAIETYEPSEIYQAYLDNGMWFEMVAALAESPQSEEWAILLESLEIPDVDPTPQTLIPIGD